MTRAVTEQRVAELVVAHLEGCGHDVYQEVAVGSGVADIVVRAGAELWIVEVKVGWSLELLEQCIARRHHCHRVFAATSRSRNFGSRARLAHLLGIGVFEVSADHVDSYASPSAAVRLVGDLPPRLTSRQVALAGRLDPEHKTHAKAGAPGAAGRWTPFRATCEAVLDFVRRSPGTSVKEVVDGARHHYRTPAAARSCIAKWAQAGAIDGVEVRRDERGRITLWPAGSP